MLVRFVIENLFSFGEQKMLNMYSERQIKTIESHLYNCSGINVNKLGAIFGPNGSGKSNLVKGLDYLKRLVTDKELPDTYKNAFFKFTKSKRQYFEIRFVQNGSWYCYGIEFKHQRIERETLTLVGPNHREYVEVFDRSIRTDQMQIKFSKEFESIKKNQAVKDALLKEFVQEDKPVFKFLAEQKNSQFAEIKNAYAWFEDTFQTINPDESGAIAHRIEKDVDFKIFVEKLLESFDLGIQAIKVNKTYLEEYAGFDDSNEIQQLIAKVEGARNNLITIRDKKGDNIVIVKERNRYVVKTLSLEHKFGDTVNTLSLEEESDGIQRLLTCAEILHDILYKGKVVVIDELNRSIHPVLIKELLLLFGNKKDTTGQLIFTTHDSNLMDIDLFRTDEIIFTEMNPSGNTDFYRLCDCRGVKGDIRANYLMGRYGAIAELGKLKDLNL